MHPSPRRAGLALVAVLSLAACTGGTGTTGSGGVSSPSVAAASSAPAASQPLESAPAASAGSAGGGGGDGGSETVRVVLTGGPDAGTYTATADPLCTNGVIGEGGWGVQYSTADLTGEKDFTSLQLVYYPDGPPAGEAMFGDTPLLVTVTIGPMLEGRTYEISVKEAAEESAGEGSVTVQDGDRPVIEVSGTTDDGVGIEATINCPSVTRV